MRNQVNGVKIRHTASAADKLKEAHRMLGITNQLTLELEAIYNRLSRVRISDPELKRLIQVAMAPNKETLENLRLGREDLLSCNYTNIVSSVFDYAMTSPNQQEETVKGTLFGAYNAVTGYFQNVRNYRDNESKFKSILYGTGLQKGQTTFYLCAEFAKHGKLAFN